jgi:hypothetical protein
MQVEQNDFIMVPIPIGYIRQFPYIHGYCFYTVRDGIILYIRDQVYTNLLLKNPGQICRGSPFGDKLYTLARNGPPNWLEIGSWNGLGSTTCILDGFHDSGFAHQKGLLSFEIDPVMQHAAASNLATHPAFSSVRFIHKKLSSGGAVAEEFPLDLHMDGDVNSLINDQHYLINFERERILFQITEPYVPDGPIEVAVLDGGEYSGYNDWLQLPKEHLKWICLDDAMTTKSRRIVTELDTNREWIRVAHGEDRNGWAIYKHRDAFSIDL